MSIFGLDNSLPTSHAMHHVFAVFNCNLLRPYAFYCHFQVFSTCGMFIYYFVFQYCPYTFNWIKMVGSMVEWLKRRARDQHCLGSKPTLAILLCPWERRFTAHSPAWWSWQAVLNYSHISIKLQAESNILASREGGRGNCLPYVLALPSLSCESGG